MNLAMTSTRPYRYRVVDVFTTQPLEGNALAVFPDAVGLDTATMQKIARELNLSETTFIFPSSRPDCLAQVRIFTPAYEMRFAGHPTIGTSFVLLDEGRIPAGCTRFNLDEKVGAVPIRIEASARPLLWLTTPPISKGTVFERNACARALGLSPGELLEPAPQLLSAGNPTLFIPVRDPGTVDHASLDLAGVKALKGTFAEPLCVFVFAPTAGGAYSRMFAPEHGIIEDPATGSSTGPLAAYMMEHGWLGRTAGTKMVSEQGVKMGRRSELHVQLNGDAGRDGIEVGGYVTAVAEATLQI